ncbi:DNA ligase 1 isoform X1 [Anoplophora glabripennis]|uniref:DNA ligase 1 isoform X1 n=2 Tax=Anoplophora glabripennis TaxID=217634 RepID=UPI000874A61C|nr:DNA ligase 1 isoform X1 [Anoplophora glabripennis]
MVFTKAMPAGKESDSGNSSNAAQRTTFRPPWVKEGPNPLPTPAAPWTLNKTNRKDSNTDSAAEYNPLAEVQLRKTNVKTKEPQENGEKEKKNKILASVQLRKTKIEAKEPQENGSKESFFKKPALKPVPQREKTPPKKDHKIHNLPQLQKVSERVLKNRPSVVKDDSYSSSEEEEEVDDIDIDREVPTKRNALVREASMRRLSQSNIPAPPPQPGMPPPPPTMPGELPKKLLNDTQKAKLDKLRSRPKNRPDWNNLLQEIESKKKLKHVVCNDRSQPLLPEAKAPDEHFLYKSEEPNVHNELLKQIEGGIKLKRVKTNDRSKPNLDGLRKFRRQMTIEEQIQKSMSMASIPPVSVEEIADEIDEMDDIDKVRDDLQSTKQMLALELRNKEAQERENKRLLARLQNLEAELEKEKSKNKEAGNSGGGNNAADEKIIKSLKTEVEGARKTSQDLEKKYTQAAEELDSTKSQLEEMRKQNQLLEKRLQEAGQAGENWLQNDEISRSMTGKRLSLSDRKHSTAKEESDEDLEDEETAEESDGEDTEEKREKRAQKELKTLTKKLQSFKNKEDNARKERIALREIIKKHQTAIKEEKKRYKQLKKEVDKMEALMKDMDEEEEEDEEEKEPEDEESEEEEEESSEEESESESDESDSERSQSEDEDAPVEKKKTNITARVKRHENILNALKKGNFLLKTNAERLQDDLNKQKELTASLQEDLDSVLSELG